VREVAYGRLTRAQRATRHLAAGRWLERTAGDRAQERTDWMARHFSQAVELGTACGDEDVVGEAREPAVRWLMAAGDLAGRLDTARAFSLYGQAADVAEPGTPARAMAMAQLALAGRRSGLLDADAVMQRYEEALAIMRAAGDEAGAADTLIRIGSLSAAVGDPERSGRVLDEAVRILEAGPPGPVLARAYAYRAEKEMFAGRVAEAMDSANRALGMAREWGRDDVVVMALHIRGDSRCSSGDAGGLDDLREALRIARETGSASDVVTSNDYVAEWLAAIEGPAVALPQYEEGIAIAERRGVVMQGQWTRAGSLSSLFELGRWDDVDRRCRELLDTAPGHLDATIESTAHTWLTHVAVLRGVPQPAGRAGELLDLARPIGELQVMAPALVVAALLAWVRGDREGAAGHVREFADITRDAAAEYRMSQLAEAVRLALWAGRLELARSLVAEGEVATTLRGTRNLVAARAALAEAEGDDAAADAYREAAEGWRTYGNPLEEAHALLGMARVAGDAAVAATERARAAVLLDALGASAIPRT
jgi:tetratricopeptide (TPR) repeat protein